MKFFCCSLVLLLNISSLFAQQDRPVSWTWTVKDLGQQELEFTFKATIDPNWKVYSQTLEDDNGPIPTTIVFETPNNGVTALSNVETTSDKSNQFVGFDEMFHMNLSYYKNDLTIVTKVKYTNLPVAGYLDYMCCSENRCMPPTTVEFEYNGEDVSSNSTSSSENKKVDSNKKYDFKRNNILESAQKLGLNTATNQPRLNGKNTGLFKSSYDNYYLALSQARKEKKPLLVYFTGYGCVNARKMEERVILLTESKKFLEEKYIIAELYVDNWQKLDKPITALDGTSIKTIGNFWAQFQLENFQVQSQPYFAILNPYEEMLIKPRAYVPNVDDFLQFLKEGLRNY